MLAYGSKAYSRCVFHFYHTTAPPNLQVQCLKEEMRGGGGFSVRLPHCMKGFRGCPERGRNCCMRMAYTRLHIFFVAELNSIYLAKLEIGQELASPLACRSFTSISEHIGWCRTPSAPPDEVPYHRAVSRANRDYGGDSRNRSVPKPWSLLPSPPPF